MQIVFVHGFGGESGGKMEQALATRAAQSSHVIVPFRWKAGSLRSILGEGASSALGEVLVDSNPLRRAARVLLAVQQHTRSLWESTLADSTAASLALVGKIRKLVRAREDFAIIAFSLGARVTVMALQSVKDDLRPLQRVIFAGAAVSRSAFELLPRALRPPGGDRVVNVYSDEDYVLRGIFPLIDGCRDAAGVNPVQEQGVKNIRVDAGHLSYPRLARLVFDLAVE